MATNTTNIYSLSEGIQTLAFNALQTTSATVSEPFAVPPGKGSLGRAITWQASYAVAPGAVSLNLQGAFNDVEAEYAILDTSTAVGGETKTVLNCTYRFVRTKQVSRTGDTAYTTIRLWLAQ